MGSMSGEEEFDPLGTDEDFRVACYAPLVYSAMFPNLRQN